MVTILTKKNSIISTWMAELRDKDVQTDSMRFRRNLERIGEVAALEISRKLKFTKVEVTTPMGISSCVSLSVQPILATILRAGLPLHQGLLNYFDKADCAFVAAYRKHEADGTFIIRQEYVTCPPLQDRPLIVADPMLATGASLVQAIEGLLEHGTPTSLHIVAAIASKAGVEMMERKFPDAFLWIGAVDEELTAKAYIVPGLGDAGDLAYGSKKQF